MRIYIAGGSSERLTVVRPWIDRAIAAGLEVTYDWTRDPTRDLREAARADLAAIRRSKVLWYLRPAAPSEGAGTELGYGLAIHHVRVIASGPLRDGRIFDRLVAESFAEHEEAFAWLRATEHMSVHPSTRRKGQSVHRWDGQNGRQCTKCGFHVADGERWPRRVGPCQGAG